MGVSRTASAANSRAGSVAKEILRRRDKPYRIETSRVLDKRKKKKLDVHTSFRRAPPGYTFLPVGTPELAARCREISRQKQLPIYVANAKPSNQFAADPASVSHHIARIGYHFSAGVVDEACEQLGYILHRGQFVKETDLQAQNEQSRIAKTMEKHGLKVDKAKTNESPSQVRAAVKELFPKIPEHDLDAIVSHAWENNSGRVGTRDDIPLSRRVQLATIARIRHEYTDYDRLLRAFGQWSQARTTVEPDCLRKLIEWRGENDAGDDDEELHEIVRETIVIPDDDEDASRQGSEADDEDSAAELGDTSDASMEITHQLAAPDDLALETPDESSRRIYPGHVPRHVRQMENWNSIARQKVGDMRRQIREAPPPTDAVSVAVQPNERGELPSVIVVDGQVFQRAPPQHEPFHDLGRGPMLTHDHFSVQPPPPISNHVRRSPQASAQYSGLAHRDQPLASIETQGRPMGLSPMPGPSHAMRSPDSNLYPTAFSEAGRAPKRHRRDYGSDAEGPMVRIHPNPGSFQVGTSFNPNPLQQRPVEIGDLAASERRRDDTWRGLSAQVHGSGGGFGGQSHSRFSAHHGAYFNESIAPGQAAARPYRDDDPFHTQQTEPEPYDPTRPLINMQSHGSFTQHLLNPSHPPAAQPINYVKPQQGLRFYELPPENNDYRDGGGRTVYRDIYQPQLVYVSSDPHLPSHQPVHGAPAPVQQISRQPGQRPIFYAQPTPPVEGAPHPAQMYHPR